MDRIIESSVIKNVLWSRANRTKTTPKSSKIEAYIPSEMRLVISGEGDKLGNWQPINGVDLICNELPFWYLPQNMKIESGVQFKFVVMKGDEIIAWEGGENRLFDPEIKDFGKFENLPQFDIKFSGVAIPLFSLRSKGCEGIGDFVALGEFAEWAAQCGMKVVQTLPVNDTTISHTFLDSYPYNAISVFALNPLYIRISEMDKKTDVSELLALESKPDVDYEAVDRLKWKLFRDIYQKKGKRIFATQSYKDFYSKNKGWVDTYAAFSFLRDKYKTANYEKWDKPYCRYTKRSENKLLKEFGTAVSFYKFLQYYADAQLREAHQKANSLGVALKGDIPIGVSRYSVDVWREPHLFNLDSQAGAPPDDFAKDGQNWGFPTYNWREMSQDNYKWWKRRFEKMADYFDMYRIDHILGFFRIWEIPKPHKSGLMGHFSPALPFCGEELAKWGLPMYEDRYLGVDEMDTDTLFVRDHNDPALYHPRIMAQYTDRYCNTLDQYEKERFNALYDHYFYQRHNDFWAAQALNRLPSLIDSTDMLACAEDLGMIPDCVEGVLRSLQIATLEIQRMPKNPDEQFGNPTNYPYLSVASTSTHDMSPLRAWWEESSEVSGNYYSNVMYWGGEAPEVASGEICKSIVESHLQSSSMAVILPWQDFMSISEECRYKGDVRRERINEPAHVGHYWRYRMHMDVDQLKNSCKELNVALKEMITKSER